MGSSEDLSRIDTNWRLLQGLKYSGSSPHYVVHQIEVKCDLSNSAVRMLILKRISAIGMNNCSRFIQSGWWWEGVILYLRYSRIWKAPNDTAIWWKHIHPLTYSTSLIMLIGIRRNFSSWVMHLFPVFSRDRCLYKSLHISYSRYLFRLGTIFT